MKILTIRDLDSVRDRAAKKLQLREQSDSTVDGRCCGLESGTGHMQVLICGGTGCKASSSHLICGKIKELLEEKGLSDRVDVVTTGCFGFCEKGPVVKIIPDNTFYTQVKPEDAVEIVQEHIVGGRRVERLLYRDDGGRPVLHQHENPFYAPQHKIALRNIGAIDPHGSFFGRRRRTAFGRSFFGGGRRSCAGCHGNPGCGIFSGEVFSWLASGHGKSGLRRLPV